MKPQEQEKEINSYEYEAGKDYAKNGANTVNCNFAIFSSPESTKAWEAGRDSILSPQQ